MNPTKYTPKIILPLSQKTCPVDFVHQFLPRPMTPMTPTTSFPKALDVIYSKNGVRLFSYTKCGHSSQGTWKGPIWNIAKNAKSGQKTAKPKFSKIRQKSNFGPIVRSRMWKLIRRARPFRLAGLNQCGHNFKIRHNKSGEYKNYGHTNLASPI